MNKLNLFVSSTCYDLSQIRADLSEFILESGYNPFLSEYDDFPINPQLSTIENCIRNVKESADILILIVGNRYGSIIETGKSITNTEFLTAKQKGIPIFCFIDKKTLGALNFWQENKEGNFSKFVDNTKIFEFVEDIRCNSQIWTFGFDKAQDIISILKVQLSYLFRESLKIRNIFENRVEEYFKINLSNRALRILVDRDKMFEHEFFAQTLVDEISKKEDLKNDFKYSLVFESKNFVYNSAEISNWIIGRTTSLQNIISSLSTLMNTALSEFLNEPGQPSDLRGLHYVSKTFSALYENLIRWKLDTNSSYIGDENAYLKESLSNIANKAIQQTWDFPFYVLKEITSAKQRLLEGETNIELTLKITINLEEEALNQFSKDMNTFRNTLQ